MDPKKNENDEQKRSYLQFLAFTMKENLSFSQISSLGKFIRDLVF